MQILKKEVTYTSPMVIETFATLYLSYKELADSSNFIINFMIFVMSE